MSRRSLAPLLLAGTTFVALTGCTAGQQANTPAVVVAPPRPVDPAALLAEGDRLAASGDLYAAVDSYMAARRAAPTSADAAARLGLTLAEQGRHAEALAHLKDAERVREGDLAITRVLVNALLALERPSEAAARLAPALTQHPEDARLWNASGIAADMMGDSTAAAAAYRNGLAAAPDNLSLRVNLALSRFASGDAEGAAMAASAAGLPMAEVESRAKRLIAYRSRTLGQMAAAGTAKLGTVPEAPPMVALAMPPVRVQELPPVAVQSVAVRPAAAAPAPDTTAETKTSETAAQTSPETMPLAETTPSQAPATQIASAQPAAAESVATATEPVAETGAAAPEPAATAPTAAPAERQTVVASANPAPPVAAVGGNRPDAPAAETTAVPGTASWAHAGGPQVQLAAYGRAALAETQWAKLKAAHPALLDGLEPVIQRADLGTDKGVIYRLRVAVADQGAGAALCERLRAAGLDCVPVPTL